jgi:hypothetical protein
MVFQKASVASGHLPSKDLRNDCSERRFENLREPLRCTEDVGAAGSPAQTPLFLQGIPRRIFGAADRVLHLASRFPGRAFGLRLCITGYLADGFLDRALDLLGGACDPILVHDDLLIVACCGSLKVGVAPAVNKKHAYQMD